MDSGLFIEGNNVHVFKYIDAAPFEIVCAVGMTLTIKQELIGATTPESGNVREKRPRLQEYSLNLTGATTSDNDSNISIFYLLNNIREAHDLNIVFTDNNGNDRSFRADFIIESNDLTGNAGEASQYDLRLEGGGDYVLSTLTVPPVSEGSNITSDSYTVSGGLIQDNDWIGLTSDNIIEVCREGSEQLSLGLAFTFNGTTGEITPDPSTTIDGQRMFVIWTY